MVITGNLFLVGPMGAGKSTIGRHLAKRLRRTFLDSDREIEQRTGVSISWIFEMEGEAGFREREQKMIEALTEMDNIVLATGGGAVLAEMNRQYLSERGTVIYLAASAEQLFRRMARDKSRPLLQTGDKKKQIKSLLTKRDPLYREIADIVVLTGEQSVQRTVTEVIRKLEQKQKETKL
ncbi:shikimate kinase AroK [Methylophaga frappieri]|uniref:shikimate kinase AroK n=1 Tax=Methylophaga frappieri (strain ATCC BAA-2434 / DSM 25690 / JAM7) TaxID=754477 RepID=UPI0019309D3B|nr:shikimate kinase AroK [Methylophaga frappieri]